MKEFYEEKIKSLQSARLITLATIIGESGVSDVNKFSDVISALWKKSLSTTKNIHGSYIARMNQFCLF